MIENPINDTKDGRSENQCVKTRIIFSYFFISRSSPAFSAPLISPTEEIAGTQNDPCTPKASNFYHDGPSVTDWTKKRYRVPKTTRYFDRSAIYQIHTINDDGQTYSHVLLAQLLTSTHVHDVSQNSFHQTTNKD
jgi:hypothetical protein